jgi:hypothetical protein
MKSNFEGPNIMKHHLVSGAAVSLLSAGTINAVKLKRKEVTPLKAAHDVVKRTTQGTLATAAVVAASNYKDQPNGGVFKAFASLAIGAAGVYAVELIDKKLNLDVEEQVEELAVEAIE